MARILSQAGTGAIFPPGTAVYLKRRLSEGAGALLIAVAIAFALALASFDPGDPSLNTATDSEPHNFLGRPGATVADLAIQLFGVAAAAPAIALLVWGWRMMRKTPPQRLWLRAFGIALAMVPLAVGGGALPPAQGALLPSGFGGIVGAALLEPAARLGARLHPMIDAAVIGSAATAAGAIVLIAAIGLTFADWRAFRAAVAAAWEFARASFSRSRAVFSHVREAMPPRFGVAVGHFDGGASGERLEPTLKRRGGAAEADDDGDDDARPSLRATREPLVAAKAPKAKPGRRADAQRQRQLPLGNGDEYRVPPLDLLDAPADKRTQINEDALAQNARLLGQVLTDFGVSGEIVKVRPGPVVTLYELEPAPGTKTSRVIALADDIARSMSSVSARIAVVPGRNAIGIELPNAKREMVHLRELLASETCERAGAKLPLALGKDIGGTPVIADLSRMPHLLIAGTTGSGKSVAMNTMILSLIYQLAPEQCRFIMVDPKMLELSVYEGIPHLLCPVVTDPGKAVVALKWTVREMEERYRLMAQLGVRNIAGYNTRLAEAKKKGETLTRRVQTGFDEQGRPIFEDQVLATDPLPFIVVVVDEMADLMLVAGKDIEAAVQRLAQMARASGIHLMMATQRPSVDVITGTIKANFPTRISFQVTSKIDSRTILGEQGAEQLLGQGDMLYMAGGGRITRVHGPFVSDAEVEAVVRFVKSQGEPEYVDAVTEEPDEPGAIGPDAPGGGGNDEFYDQAVALVAREGKASTSFIQRHFQIGYNRAARIIERMEAEGVVSKPNRVGRREVLVNAA